MKSKLAWVVQSQVNPFIERKEENCATIHVHVHVYKIITLIKIEIKMVIIIIINFVVVC